jgi:hypothetical protein
MDILENYKFYLSILGTIISASNLVFYIYTVVKGQTKPHAYTWLIWSLITIIAAYAQYKGGAGIGLILTCWIAIACLTNTVLAFFKGTSGITLSDKICLTLCLIAIALWQTLDSPVYSLILVTCIDTAGFYPTIRKSWHDPYSLGVMALENYNFTYGYLPKHCSYMLVWPICIFDHQTLSTATLRKILG